MNENKVLACKLLDVYEFSKEMEKYDRILIYGAGMVGQFVLDYLTKHALKDKVFCFFTTEQQDNSICGIPVKTISSNVVSQDDSILLLAAKRAIRKEMATKCEELHITNIKEIDVLDDRDYEYNSHIPEVAYPLELKEWYKNVTGEELNLENPRTFNEKINWMKLYDKDPRKTRLADKYLVREYVKEKIGEQYLIPLLGVWDKFDDIDFDKLPSQFVLKCNHGCGWNWIVKDKAKLDINDIRVHFNKWMSMNYSFVYGFELHYTDIKPKIIAEYYLEAKRHPMYEYKFMCFGGIPKFYWIRNNVEDKIERSFFDIEDRKQNFKFGDADDLSVLPPIQKETSSLLKRLVSHLCDGFKMVRVDMIVWNGSIYFGEMTFSSGSGVDSWKPYSDTINYGKYIDINGQ